MKVRGGRLAAIGVNKSTLPTSLRQSRDKLRFVLAEGEFDSHTELSGVTVGWPKAGYRPRVPGVDPGLGLEVLTAAHLFRKQGDRVRLPARPLS